uniref:Putative salivary kunitz domain protein n=1 Tax=Ixodes ricinus TaxID=34613 RepID=A0A0K8RIY7_IXORI
MRLSCILCFLAMFLFAYADHEPQCTRKWPIPPFQCLFLCQHGEWKFLQPLPRFTVEQKVNGRFCRWYGLLRGMCCNGRCIRATNMPITPDMTVTPEDSSAENVTSVVL